MVIHTTQLATSLSPQIEAKLLEVGQLQRTRSKGGNPGLESNSHIGWWEPVCELRKRMRGSNGWPNQIWQNSKIRWTAGH